MFERLYLYTVPCPSISIAPIIISFLKNQIFKLMLTLYFFYLFIYNYYRDVDFTYFTDKFFFLLLYIYTLKIHLFLFTIVLRSYVQVIIEF